MHTRRADDQHCAVTSLVCIENTQNRCGGAVLSLDYMRRLRAWADSKVMCACTLLQYTLLCRAPCRTSVCSMMPHSCLHFAR